VWFYVWSGVSVIGFMSLSLCVVLCLVWCLLDWVYWSESLCGPMSESVCGLMFESGSACDRRG